MAVSKYSFNVFRSVVDDLDLKSVVYLFQIQLPFSSLRPIFRARTVLDAPPFDPSNIVSLQACLCISYFYLHPTVQVLTCCKIIAAHVQQV